MSNMKQFIVLFCMATACTGTFLTSQKSSDPEAYNLCIFSKDPGQYHPNCFLCPTSVYTNALQACVNGTTMPSNISYSSATCMESNCAINYPKSQTSAPFDKIKFFESLGSLFRMTRSVEDNAVGESLKESMIQTGIPKSGWKIIAEIETFASDFGFELDYNA